MAGLQRIRRNRNDSFTTINNAILRDKTISLKAKAVMVTVMGLPETWDFSVQGLIAIVKEGKDAIYSAIDELIKAGYVVRNEIRTQGRFEAYEYVFNEHSSALEPHTGFPHTVNPQAGKPQTENPLQYKKQEIKETKNKETYTHTGGAGEWDYPMADLISAFPDLQFQPGQVGNIQATVCDTPVDREAWTSTIQIYRENYDPLLNRYVPTKVGNLLGVFRNAKSKIERTKNASNKPAYGRRTDADVFAESADFYANYDKQYPA